MIEIKNDDTDLNLSVFKHSFIYSFFYSFVQRVHCAQESASSSSFAHHNKWQVSCETYQCFYIYLKLHLLILLFYWLGHMLDAYINVKPVLYVNVKLLYYVLMCTWRTCLSLYRRSIKCNGWFYTTALHSRFYSHVTHDCEAPSTFMRWMGPGERPKSLHMKATMFALLPLKGQTSGKEKKWKQREADASVEELSTNSEQRVLPVLLNMN